MITYRALGREGRLGNQLWQIAATIGAARRLGDTAGFAYWRYRPYFSVPDSLFPDDVGGADDLGIVHPQNRRHLDGVEDVVRRCFAPRPEVWSRLAVRFADVLALPQKTSVHVRRGDYVDHGGYFTILSPEYYAEAMAMMEGTYLVFSDDLEWCRRHLPGECLFMDHNMDHEDLFLMAACDAHVASNSTFSWWASWLSGAPTVYPRQWGAAFDNVGSDVLADDAITLDVICESVARVNLSGATVLVTGGTGFLGRQVVARLEEAGAAAVGVGTADADLRRRGEIDRLLDDVSPAAVVHLAAVTGGIGANRAEPGRFFYDNAIMGIELLESCRLHGVGKVLVSGTVCSYPKFTPVPFSEDAIWDGYPEETNAPYGLAKKMLLVQAQAYREQYGFNAVHLLLVNLFGPGDTFDLESSHVIPAMIRRFAEAMRSGASEVVLWGDGSPTREFVYVRDAATALCLALERYDGAAPVNVGSGRAISIKELAETVADAVGYAGGITWDASKPNGQPSRCLDTSRARDLFGFETTTSFADGLAETIAWYESQ